MSIFPGANGGIFSTSAKETLKQEIVAEVQQSGGGSGGTTQQLVTLISDLPSNSTNGTLIYVKETSSLFERKDGAWLDSELDIKDLLAINNNMTNNRLELLEDKLAGFQLTTLGDLNSQCYFKQGEVV